MALVPTRDLIIVVFEAFSKTALRLEDLACLYFILRCLCQDVVHSC